MMSDAMNTQGTKSMLTKIIPAGSSEDAHMICAVCQRHLKDPRLLPCLHSFCKSCIKILDPYVVSSDDQTSSLGSENSLSSDPPGKHALGSITILCPTCDVEVELPRRGPSQLPIDFLTRKLLLLDSIDPESCELTCDLCTDKAKAVSRCLGCMANVCEFCVQAHKRQRKTAGHVVISLQEAQQQGTTSLRCPVTCTKHPQEEIKMYCETCDCPVCRDCCLIQHREHLVEFTEDSADHHRRIISNLIARLQPHIQAIDTGINSIDEAELAINNHAIQLSRDINSSFDNYLQVLQSQRQSLLKKVAKACDKQLKSLQAHKMQLQQVFTDMQHSCDFSSRVLAEGDNEELLSVKPTLSRRLSCLSRVTYQCTPKSDLSLRFKPNVPAGSIAGFQIYGILENKMVDPTRCYAEGQGISNATTAESANLVVITFDSEGQRHSQGGEHVTAQISANNKPGRGLPCHIEDKHDGTYHVKYAPQQSGLHSLSICVNDTHIKGSPFQVKVRPPTQQHSGVWHCCTFCSSEGNKEASCACGGEMPGGFKGCGHGHPGHPGRWHWSCCGSLKREANHCIPVTTVLPMSTSSRTAPTLTSSQIGTASKMGNVTLMRVESTPLPGTPASRLVSKTRAEMSLSTADRSTGTAVPQMIDVPSSTSRGGLSRNGFLRSSMRKSFRKEHRKSPSSEIASNESFADAKKKQKVSRLAKNAGLKNKRS